MSFKPVNPKQQLPEIEHEVLDFWKKEHIFEKSVKKNEGKERYVFYDGPPFANGMPHYGHIMANSLKDAVTRFWNMRGYYVPRRNGWDTHGLPVEYEIEKEQGVSGKREILDKFGIEKFNELCRESVFRYTKEWEQTLERIGRWVDFENSYATLDTSYMETIMWIFKSIWEKGMVYQDYRSMHICPRCETPLSNFEVNQGYKDVTDPTAIAKFKLSDKEDTYIIAWTTTPWTLPGNAALAVGEDIDYVTVKIDNEFIILAKELVEANLKDCEYEIIDTFKGKTLVGTSYEPLFDNWNNTDIDLTNAHKVYSAEFVSTEDGTGIVHIAPAFGEDDLVLGQQNDIPILQHVSITGEISEVFPQFEGVFVKEADKMIIEELKKSGLLFSRASYHHSYPHCWRCDTPLINYARKAWFVKVTDIKENLLGNNEKIHWQPEHLKAGRFGKWLEGARDWNVSRNRFWGAPIPVWECESCGKQTCLGSVKEIEEKSGGQLPKRKGEVDLHRPFIDEITIPCECGDTMHRVEEVLDCWFESGSMPYAQDHYPFKDKEEFEHNFPAQFIAEGLDQTRGWFYTLHVLAGILFDEPAFSNVIVNGILLAENGEKLSKSKKNYPDPNVLFETTGVDSLRHFLYSSTAALAEDVRFSERLVGDVVKRFTLTLWNTYSFFVTYANLDNWNPNVEIGESDNALDRWILSELQLLIKEVTREMEDYNLTHASRAFEGFVDNVSNWYVRRSRRRFWKSENDADKDHAYQTLHTVLVTLSKILAPFMPFISEEIYKNLTGKESVHLEDWPVADEGLIDETLHTQIEAVRLVVNLGHAVRSRNTIKVRQPLQLIKVGVPSGFDSHMLEEYRDVILEELNIKELEILKDATQMAEQIVKPNAKILGPKYGSEVQRIIKNAKSGNCTVNDDMTVTVDEFTLRSDEYEIGYESKEGLNVDSEKGFVVGIDTEVTDSLRKEGLMRDLIRIIQDTRKENDMDVADRIEVTLTSESDELGDVLSEFEVFIKEETLSEVITVSNDSVKGASKWNDKMIAISIKKTA